MGRALEYLLEICPEWKSSNPNEEMAKEIIIRSHMRLRESEVRRSDAWIKMNSWKRWLLKKLFREFI